MLEDVVGALRCPHCFAGLELSGRVVRCPNAHAFDVARHGYVSLLRGDARAGGDTAAMVAARERTLAAGHFDPLARALADAASGSGGRCIVDVGAGTGFYLARVLDALAERAGVALDVSRYALRRAARAHARIGAVACDVWRELPLADASADLALSVFAPRNGDEIARVLAPGGRLIVVTPTPRHLEQLVASLGLLRVGEDKHERLDEQLRALQLVERRPLEWTLSLDAEQARDLVAMGPSAWHLDAQAIEARAIDVDASVELSIYRR